MAALVFLSCFDNFLNADLFDIIDLYDFADLYDYTSLLSAPFLFGLRLDYVSASLLSSTLSPYIDSLTDLMIVFLKGAGSSLPSHSSDVSYFLLFFDFEDFFVTFRCYSLSSSLSSSFDSSSESETCFFFLLLPFLPPSN